MAIQTKVGDRVYTFNAPHEIELGPEGPPKHDVVYITAFRQWFKIVEGKTCIPKVEKR